MLASSRLLTHVLLGAAPLALVAALASPAFAQVTDTATPGAPPAPLTTPATPEAAAPDTPSAGAGEIVVTGSRLARPDLTQASPVQVVSAADIGLKAQTNVENVLNDLPQVVGSRNGASNNPGDGTARVNLRGIGSQRTLVLVDGRRYINFGPDQIVDLNTVPSDLIDRVEVVTGGRSAVYGSDAIAGVVNFVMKQNFSGLEANARYELSGAGDGARKGASALIGANFDDNKGNVVAYVDYFLRDGVFADARKSTTTSYSDGLTIGAPGTIFPGGSSSIPSFRFTAGSLSNRRFDQNGNIIPYNSATDLYNFGVVNYLQIPQERYLGYFKAHYDVDDHFKPFIEGQFVDNLTATQLAPTPVGNTTAYRTGSLGSALQLQVNSPFLSPSAQAALAAVDATQGPSAALPNAVLNDGYVNVTAFGRRFLETGPRISNDERNSFRVLAGATGDLFAGFTYSGFYSYSRTKDSQTQTGNIGITAFLNSVRTAFLNPATGTTSAFPIAGLAGGGTLVCADASARAAGCVPANIFGAGTVSSAAASYIAIGAQNQTTASEEVAQFVVQNNNLFDLGAGGVGLVGGVEYRKERAIFTPDTYLSSGDVAGFNAAKPTQGSYDLTEFFGEVNVPLLADRPFFNRLEINGAARYSKYSNAVGNVWTYSGGALWKPIADFTLRGQYQRAIRGPSVNELFQGTGNSFNGATDPCQAASARTNATLNALCVATGVPAAAVGTNYGSGGTSFLTFTGGNPNLREEKSTTYTFGGVLQPSFFRNFAVTVDYYHIKIDNYISTVGTQNLVTGCYTYNVADYCGRITRASTGELQSFVDTNINGARLKTDGIDGTATLALPLAFGLIGEGSKLNLRYTGNYIRTFDYTPVTGLPLVNHCAGKFGRNCSQNVTTGTLPKYRHAFRTTYSDGPLSLSVQWRYIGKVRDDDDTVVYGLERIKAVNYFDAALQANVTDNFKLTFAINNVFNKGFQPGASTQQGGNVEQSNTYPETYDVLGRYFSIGAKVRF